MSLTLPPRYVNSPTNDLFDLHIPDSVYRSLVMIHALAWETNGQYTPCTTVLELARLRGLQERQMYTHLRDLKDLRRIRIENRGHGEIVIYPLRWGTDAALSTDKQSDVTEADLARLASDEQIMAKERPPNFTAKNCSKTAKEDQQHVVVESHASESESESKQQHAQQHGAAKNCSKTETIQAIAEIFIGDGDDREQAITKAANFVQTYGLELCQQQLNHFPRRCQLARESEVGLRNASGLFISSVRYNYSPPPETQKDNQPKTWYSDDEFDQLIQH